MFTITDHVALGICSFKELFEENTVWKWNNNIFILDGNSKVFYIWNIWNIFLYFIITQAYVKILGIY